MAKFEVTLVIEVVADDLDAAEEIADEMGDVVGGFRAARSVISSAR